MGGELIRKCTSRAPPSRKSPIIFRLVVPRTIESSTRITRFPLKLSRIGFNLILTSISRVDWAGRIKVLPI